MLKSIGRARSLVLELLLPSANAQACTSSWCQPNGGQHRCCHSCPGGIVCGPWVAGNCSGVYCGQ